MLTAIPYMSSATSAVQRARGDLERPDLEGIIVAIHVARKCGEREEIEREKEKELGERERERESRW